MKKRILAYSHDTFGLGNIRRMLTICESLLIDISELDILLVSGSPMIHSFRLPKRLDYIKLPCLSRQQREGYAVKTLQTDLDETIGLRADIIRKAVVHFRPDVMLVDKKPYGVKDELAPALSAHQNLNPNGKRVLLLRDILDRPDVTTATWTRRRYHPIVQALYDLVLVVGSPEVFDLSKEYQFPAVVADKVRFCGYLRRTPEGRDAWPDSEANPDPAIPYVLVTVGGGEDGYHLLLTYVQGLNQLPDAPPFGSCIVCGPEMPPEQRQHIEALSAKLPQVQVCEFTDAMVQLMAKADVVVTMGGYNTVCELLSLSKRAIVVPRIRPVEEQWIRASRMARLGWLRVIHPDRLTPLG
ncbi:glycosyltransferase family protein [Candidatus Entotheonella palauensis]|uniref:glycosyltransferase family protein n=1 Tax=Candidatus Entotheonella palauensis TaxID=93172 RepID=UPI0015C455F5|nr:glycosyltransferase [Candidatus Entotheonella palauensis]